MRLIQTIDDLAGTLHGARPVFVPTMGALHQGHLALIRRGVQLARQEAQGAPLVVSIFVNPTQFGPNEDYTRYPRTLEADCAAAASAGAEIVFAPAVDTIYPKKGSDPFFGAPVPRLPAVATQPGLEDAQRPTHFAGVCQVVARLLDLVQPAAAVFGEKDYQQLLVIQALVEQEASRWPGLRIVAHPTVREPDGLAMSSRNAYLKPRERDRALGLFRALRAAQHEGKESGPATSVALIERIMRQILEEHRLVVDYAVVRHARTLMPITDLGSAAARGLIAARLGAVRLIDNMPLP